MVKAVTYQPDRGDFIYLDFSPQAGTEQAGWRQGLVLSPKAFNIAVGLAYVCPMTNTQTGSNFEVALPRGIGLNGVVLTHQMRSVDWLSRRAQFHSKAPPTLLETVLNRIEAVLSIKLSP